VRKPTFQEMGAFARGELTIGYNSYSLFWLLIVSELTSIGLLQWTEQICFDVSNRVHYCSSGTYL